MKQIRLSLALVCGLFSVAVTLRADEPRPQGGPQLSDTDRTRLAESFRLADKLGNQLWPDWDKAPFAVLLVTPDREFLLRHPKPSDDFVSLGEDAVLKEKVWSRKRKYPANFLATFPAVGGVPTVVIGQAENTEAKTSTRWVVTLLHEHFHQLQSSQPRYYPDVDSLGLARGDQTGMWMLNYPFPYAKPEVKEQFSAMSKALAEALAARQKPSFADKLTAYRESRMTFRSTVTADDWKYFAFQVWQEGIARYTEYRLAELAAADYESGKEFQGLKDYLPYKNVARQILDGIEKDLVAVDLEKAKRTAVYNFGAAEGLLPDRARPKWTKRYFEDRFSLDAHFRDDQ